MQLELLRKTNVLLPVLTFCNPQLSDPEFRARLGEECADVLLYLLLICERAGIDLITAASEKIEINAAKYPVEKARGNARKYTDL